MTINIFIENDILFLDYSPEYNYNWVRNNFEIEKEINIKNIFYFNKADLYEKELTYNSDENTYIFVLGVLDSERKYFIITGKKLGIPYDIYFDKTIEIKNSYFIGARRVAVFKIISKVLTDNLIIGVDDNADINIKIFDRMIKKLPNQYEIEMYVKMRTYNIIKDELDKIKDATESYEDYMNKKYSKKDILLDDSIKIKEKSKFEFLRDKLNNMLLNKESYNETSWQNNIFDIIKIIFPKYLYVLREAPVSDYYNKKKRKIDFLLVDFCGNIDIIEIKKPYNNQILRNSKYRDNFIPAKDLSGTVMQIEKYLFHLCKSGIRGERKLNDFFHKHINSDLCIKIINPSGIIIMGKDDDIKECQMNDFELIKRKYKSIIDIITYDDLLRRLEQLIIKYSN